MQATVKQEVVALEPHRHTVDEASGGDVSVRANLR